MRRSKRKSRGQTECLNTIHCCRRSKTHEAVVGIVGLGYVGLPLAIAFVEAGFHVLGIDVDPQVVDGLIGRAIAHWRRAVRGRRIRGRQRPSVGHHGFRETGGGRRRRYLRPDAAVEDRGPRSLVRHAGHRVADASVLRKRPAGGARVHDLSGNDSRPGDTGPRGVGPQGGVGLLRRVQSGAGRSGEPHVAASATHRRSSAGLRRVATAWP